MQEASKDSSNLKGCHQTEKAGGICGICPNKGSKEHKVKSSLHNNGKEKEFTQGAEYDIGPAVAACEREIGIEKAVMLFPSAVGNVDNWHVMRSKRLHAFACESDGAARSLFPEAGPPDSRHLVLAGNHVGILLPLSCHV